MGSDLRATNPLTPHIRGNARLRRKLDAQAARLTDIKRAVGVLLVLADKHGFGDRREAKAAAASIGWVRWTDEEKAAWAEKIRVAGGR